MRWTPLLAVVLRDLDSSPVVSRSIFYFWLISSECRWSILVGPRVHGGYYVKVWRVDLGGELKSVNEAGLTYSYQGLNFHFPLSKTELRVLNITPPCLSNFVQAQSFFWKCTISICTNTAGNILAPCNRIVICCSPSEMIPSISGVEGLGW